MRIYITPCAGRRVRDPQTGDVVPNAGAWKIESTQWHRLKAAGDCTISKKAPKAAAQQPKKGA